MIDGVISGWMDSSSPLVVLCVALLLGLRHAGDPDHLVAMSTIVATERTRATRRATVLGVSWGLGHATSVVVLGLPLVLLERSLPESVQRVAEFLVGVVVMALAVRLLVRWRRGFFHTHVHTHGGERHYHLHTHAASLLREHPKPHDHDHAVMRSSSQAYGIGVLHGVGGSAALTLLLLASVDDPAARAASLVIFSLGTAISMALLSTAFGYALGRDAVRRRFWRIVPALGAVGLLFGAWYALGALQPPA